MSRTLHHLLTLLLASALLLGPVASAGMVHGEQGADRTTLVHCPDHDAGLLLDPLAETELPACEMSCTVCGVCGVSAVPPSVIMPVTVSLSSPVPGPMSMGPGARAGPDLRPPL